MADTMTRFELLLNDEHSMALAQFVKRAQLDNFRACSVDDEEAYTIQAAVLKLQEALAAGGYAPR